MLAVVPAGASCDALTDVRELLAVAELDRAVDLVTAGLVASRIPLSANERDERRALAMIPQGPT